MLSSIFIQTFIIRIECTISVLQVLECFVVTLAGKVAASPIEIIPHVGHNTQSHETLLFTEFFSALHRILSLLPLIAKLSFSLFISNIISHHQKAMRKIISHPRHTRFGTYRRQWRSGFDEEYTHIVISFYSIFYVEMNYESLFFQLPNSSQHLYRYWRYARAIFPTLSTS